MTIIFYPIYNRFCVTMLFLQFTIRERNPNNEQSNHISQIDINLVIILNTY